MNEQELQAMMLKLQSLERENQRLKTELNGVGSDQLVVTETDYQGHPVLTFRRGNNRPFNLGVRKLQSIKEAWPKIEEFLRKHYTPNENAGMGGQFEERI